MTRGEVALLTSFGALMYPEGRCRSHQGKELQALRFTVYDTTVNRNQWQRISDVFKGAASKNIFKIYNGQSRVCIKNFLRLLMETLLYFRNEISSFHP